MDPDDSAETADVQVGKFSSDSCFRNLGDGVELILPLGLLPLVDSRAAVVINSMEPVAGLFDSFPDTGGLLLYNGTLVPYNRCEANVTTATDPAGDSFAFGGDNDDMVRFEACNYTAGSLFAIKYTDLTLIGEALTAVHLDLDQDDGTGKPFTNYNGDTRMGIENTVVSQLSSTSGARPVARGSGHDKACFGGAASTPFFTAVLVDGSSGDLVRGINALYTLDFTSDTVFVTLPDRLVGNTGVTDIHAWTMSGAFGTATFDDEIPDAGVVTLPAFSVDSDGYDINDDRDNCIEVANPDQLDTDGDDIGNACDCDFNQDDFCGGPDFTAFIGCFNASTGGEPTCEAADMNGDGFIGGPDFSLFIGGFNAAPGPSGLLP